MALKYTGDEAETVVLNNTALASLGAGSNKITTAAFVNNTPGTRWIRAKFRLELGATAARTAGDHVDIYLIPQVSDGYAFGGDSLDPDPVHLRGSFTFDAATTARDDVIEVELPSGDFHTLLINNLTVAFGATGNELSIMPVGYEDN